VTGLKTLLYLRNLKSLSDWNGQTPPVEKHQKGKPIIAKDTKLPNFGKFRTQRRSMEQELIRKADLLDTSSLMFAKRPSDKPAKVPTINEIIGGALDKIGSYNELTNKEQVVALVDDDLCINCGKCYMTCNDSGYQAIRFDVETHLPFVTDNCTGCTLCYSVCPIPECIQMVPKTAPHIIKRGIAPKSGPLAIGKADQPPITKKDGRVVLQTN